MDTLFDLLPVEILSQILELLPINKISSLIDLLELTEEQAKYIILKRFPGLFKALANDLNRLNIYKYTCKSWSDLLFDILGNAFSDDKYYQVIYEYLMYYGEFNGDLKDRIKMGELLTHYFTYYRLAMIRKGHTFADVGISIKNLSGDIQVLNARGGIYISWTRYSADSNFLTSLIILVHEGQWYKLISNEGHIDPEILHIIVKLGITSSHCDTQLLNRFFTTYSEIDYEDSLLYVINLDNMVFESTIDAMAPDCVTFLKGIGYKINIGSYINYIARYKDLNGVLKIALNKLDYKSDDSYISTACEHHNYSGLKMLLNHKTCPY